MTLIMISAARKSELRSREHDAEVPKLSSPVSPGKDVKAPTLVLPACDRDGVVPRLNSGIFSCLGHVV